ncbi:MAG: hypothetical protein GXO73_10485 [Calditrichaeota bacterium]|nr:hypothetical protein [Calditrichota bacterium]
MNANVTASVVSAGGTNTDRTGASRRKVRHHQRLVICGVTLLTVAFMFILDAMGILIALGVYSGVRLVAWVLFAVLVWRSALLLLKRNLRNRAITGTELICGALLVVFLWLLPSMKTSDYKGFFLLSEALRQCKSIDDPIVQAAFFQYRIDRYKEEPGLVRIRFSDPKDCSQILLRLANNGRTILGVEFDPD